MTTETTASHTTGPWMKQDLGQKSGYPNWHEYAIRDKKTNVCLAVIGNVDRYFEKNNEANARLIAAAPDLLAALKEMIAWQDTPAHIRGDFPPIQKRCKAVIAQAEGK